MVSIFPFDRHSIGSNAFNLHHPRFGAIRQVIQKNILVRSRTHIFVASAAGCTGAGGSHQTEWVDTGVLVVPDNRQELIRPISRNAFRQVLNRHQFTSWVVGMLPVGWLQWKGNSQPPNLYVVHRTGQPGTTR
jgi:hypothetical protein